MSNETKSLLNEIYAIENACHGGVPIVHYFEANIGKFCRHDFKNNIGKFHYVKNHGPSAPGCYFLFFDDELQYVGKASSIAARCRDHWRKQIIRFDYFSYILTPCAHVAEYVEGFFILALKPHENSYRPTICEATKKLLKEF